MRMFRTILFAMVLLVSGPALAGTCAPHIDNSGASPVFRVHTDAFASCPVSEDTYVRIIREWLASGQVSRAVSGLYLGRAVDFPWLSRHIADIALGRTRTAGSVRTMTPGQRRVLETAIFRDAALLRRLAVPFADSPYSVTGISFEKVLYGKAGEKSSHKDAGRMLVPYDAQLWLRLQ